jgi:predicted MPP superfamily phosphohydrolase
MSTVYKMTSGHQLQIFPVSDLHLEFDVDPEKLIQTFPKADILVLPGDIGVVNTCLEKMRLFLNKAKEKYSDVVFIAGNHEFYGCGYDRSRVVENLRKLAEETDTHFLEKETKVIQGIEFIGTTLWSLIDKKGCESIRDFSQNVWRSQLDYVGEFIDNFRFLKKTLGTPSKYPRIVLTHHLPTTRLMHERFRDSPANSGFYTNILDSIDTRGIHYWFSEHTHEFAVCKYIDMLCVVNPLGYPYEKRDTKLSLSTYKTY